MSAPSRVDRFEGVILVIILLSIGGASAAASFTHIHDWTMVNSPTGTGDWFGWANAVVSDLVPLGVGLEVRRRRRHHLRIGAYPITVIMAAAALSLAGQLAQARPSITGWLLAAVPALGFLALTKLVLSRPSVPEPSPRTPVVPAVSVMDTRTPVPGRGALRPVEHGDSFPDGLIPGARIIVDAYHQATGQQITPHALAERLRIPLPTAERLIRSLAVTEPSATITSPVRLNNQQPAEVRL